MGLLGSIAGAVGGLFGAITGRSNASHASDLQRDNWIYQQSNAHQLEVQDLRNAGLNPILSATNSQMAGMGSAPSTSDNGVGSAVTNAITNLQIESMRKDLRLKELAIEQGRLENDISRRISDDAVNQSNIGLNRIQGEAINARTVMEQNESNARIKQIDADIERANKVALAQIHELATRSSYNLSSAEQARATASYMASMVRLNGAKQGLTELQINDLASRLTNPKTLLDKEFWHKVMYSGDPEYMALRRSYMRGLEHDVIFNFYSGNDSSNGNRDLLNIARDMKVLLR